MDTSVIIPAFNEESRLPATLASLAEANQRGALTPLRVREVIVVDDGSSDRTGEVAHAASADLPAVSVIPIDENRGKGHAVRHGMRAASQPWMLVADADEATPWPEARKLAERCAASKNPSIAIGSRGVEGSVIVSHQSRTRESLGKSFNAAVRLLTGLPFRDTQCGFKLLPREAMRAVVDRLSVDRFAWDVELLLFARDRGVPIFEVPVIWKHQDGSRISLVFDGIEMVMTLVGIQLRRYAGALRAKSPETDAVVGPPDASRLRATASVTMAQSRVSSKRNTGSTEDR